MTLISGLCQIGTLFLYNKLFLCRLFSRELKVFRSKQRVKQREAEVGLVSERERVFF